MNLTCSKNLDIILRIGQVHGSFSIMGSGLINN